MSMSLVEHTVDIYYLWLEVGVIMREGGMEDEVIIADDMY